jgi:hypothetical protein
MSILLYYQKRKNKELFDKIHANKQLDITDLQNYIPIYDTFFSLNASNFNAIQLNNTYQIKDFLFEDPTNNTPNINVINCVLQNINNEAEMIPKRVFLKLPAKTITLLRSGEVINSAFRRILLYSLISTFEMS